MQQIAILAQLVEIVCEQNAMPAFRTVHFLFPVNRCTSKWFHFRVQSTILDNMIWIARLNRSKRRFADVGQVAVPDQWFRGGSRPTSSEVSKVMVTR
jgi:hypothetical protein